MRKTCDAVFVAVYGTLMTGERNAGWAGDAKRTACTLRGSLFDTGWGFPTFVPGSRGKVRGEILRTDARGLSRMDVLEGYPRLYRRERIQAWTASGTVEAWVYVLNDMPPGAELIRSGDWPAWRKRGQDPRP